MDILHPMSWVIAIILFVALVNHFAKTREKEIVDDNYKEEA